MWILVFLGSFAPVLFFFLTGLGYGVQSAAGKRPRGQGYLIKVGILLLADALMWMKPGTYVGNDFLGFIGLSMLTAGMDQTSSARHGDRGRRSVCSR